MEVINKFIGKWGLLLAIIFSLCAMWNSCGTTGKIQTLNKTIISLKSDMNYNDSLDREIASIEREISKNEIALRVVYDNNTVVRTTARPDDIMNQYTKDIKKLQEILEKLKNARK